MNDLTLYLAKLLLSDKPTVDKFYPFHKLSFNHNRLLEIYASLSVLCDKGVISDFFLDDIAQRYSSPYSTQKTSIEREIFFLDENPERVQERARNNNPYTESHEYGFRFEIKDFTALVDQVNEDNKLFIADDSAFAGYGYEKQKRIIANEITTEYQENEKSSVLLCIQLIQEKNEHNINSFRTLLALENQKRLKIVDGSIQNYRMVWHDDLGYERMCMVTTVVNRAARENNRKDIDIITLTVTDFEELIKEALVNIDSNKIRKTLEEGKATNANLENKQEESLCDKNYELVRDINGFKYYRHKKSKHKKVFYNDTRFKAENSWLSVLCLMIEKYPASVGLETIRDEGSSSDKSLPKQTARQYISYINKHSQEQFREKFIKSQHGSELYTLNRE